MYITFDILEGVISVDGSQGHIPIHEILSQKLMVALDINCFMWYIVFGIDLSDPWTWTLNIGCPEPHISIVLFTATVLHPMTSESFSYEPYLSYH